MNITLLTYSNGKSSSVSLHRPGFYVLLGAVIASVVGAAGTGGYWIGMKQQQAQASAVWQSEIRERERKIARIREEKRAEIGALSNRIAELRGRLSEIDALGRKLVEASNLDLGELDFEPGNGMGGPLMPVTLDVEQEAERSFAGLKRAAEELEGQIEDRRRKFSVAEGFLVDRELKLETTPAGWPIDSGWISSSYGHRDDPITGRRAFHGGTDFATHPGQSVYAVAGGVVTFAGRKGAYGHMVEINHGNGYTTRYGHNSENIVNVGQVVRAGDEIARVGSTGRSTGPHVHLEVRQDGQPKDPAPYASAER